MILAHAAHPQAVKYSGGGFGRLLSPRQYARAADTAAAGIPWAADNDCFQGLDRDAYGAMLDRIADLPGCLFVVAPDVVADWAQTRAQFDWWFPVVARAGHSVAYVIQDGQPADAVPWDQIGALFIGGTTTYKLSAEAERLGREAKRRGLWLHMGRVNSRRRFDYARATGCDSVDGTAYSRWRDTHLPTALTWHRQPLQERMPA